MSNGFEIRLDDALTSTRAVSLPGFVDMAAAKSLYERILAKAKELLAENLPPWDIVEAGIRAAYDLYIRPLAIPNVFDNVICNALVREVKKFYDSLAAS